MTFINQYARALFNQVAGLNLFIYGVLVVFIVLFLPKGIVSLFTEERLEALRKKLFHKKTKTEEA